MRRLIAFLLVIAAPAATAAAQDNGPGLKLDVEEFTLDNGMKVLTVERRSVPRVYCALYWRVGSVNERPGTTGFSHFFEHMMFKGTKKLGTTDWKKDAEINDAIEKVMGEIRGLKLKGLHGLRRGEPLSDTAAGSATHILLSDEARWKELMKEFERLQEEQKKITISEHVSKLWDQNGGTESNASTSYDLTRYYVELPANKVELFFWVESETFANPVWREFYPEREVVKEERRMRYDSQPTGLINQQFDAMFWKAHPYSWPVIGWMSDIDQYSVAEAQRYYDTHYQPQNCTAVFVGDIDRTQIREMARKYFGRLKQRDMKPEPIVTIEPAQVAEQRMVAEAGADPSLTIRWHAPAFPHADTPAVDLAVMILDGRTGRLHRTLVDDKKVALSTNAGYFAMKYGGQVNLSARPRDVKEFATLEAELIKVVEALQKDGPTPAELQKVKNQSLANLVRELDSNSGYADMLAYYDVMSDWRDVEGYLKRAFAVTADQVREAARKYFTPQGRNVLIIKRREENK